MHIGVLGVGLLGGAIAGRLQASGHTVLAYNRTAAKAEPLRSAGVEVAATAADVIRRADCTLLLLADTEAIRSVVLRDECRAVLAGQTIIQMGTIGPEESRDLHGAITGTGGEYLEAPVLGSLAEAKGGTLLIMVGGTREQFARWLPLFRTLSPEPRLIGTVGQAAALKLALNQLIAAEISAFSLSVGLVRRAHVPLETFMSILKASALFAPTFEKKLPRLKDRHYAEPNFSTRHLLKDVDLVLAEAERRGLRTDGLVGVRRLLEQAVAQGLAELDYSALYEEIDPKE